MTGGPLPRPLGQRDLDDLPAMIALSGDPLQPPLVFIDLDDLHNAEPAALGRICHALTGRAAVTVGLASHPVPQRLWELRSALTTTLSTSPSTSRVGAGTGDSGERGGTSDSRQTDQTWVAADEQAAHRIHDQVSAAPLAALTLANLLPATARADVPDGLLLESLAYSTLLSSSAFAGWRRRTPRKPARPGGAAPTPDDDPVLLERDGDTLTITLNRPARHNAFSTAVRDGLINGLDLALLDPSVSQVRLRGSGKSFSSGGDLDEFGTALDASAAHVVRLARSAGLLVHELRDRLGDRLVAEVHGACIGAGVEISSFAGQVLAEPDSFFQLPELSMGLIPGAGGTVSVTRRIGRWRTAYLALSGDRIDARTALSWGLIDDLR